MHDNALAAAMASEVAVRAELADVVNRQRSVRAEAAAMHRRAGLPDADRRVAEAATRLDTEAARLAALVAPLRLRVRAAEGEVAEARTALLGA